MTDADLIYNALLRAERRMERDLGQMTDTEYAQEYPAYRALVTLREEIGNGLAKEGR